MTHTEPIHDNLLEAYSEIKEKFPDADVELGMDVGVIKYYADPRIDVSIDIEDIDDYREKKKRVREIARKHEEDDDIIYTRVERRRDDE